MITTIAFILATTGASFGPAQLAGVIGATPGRGMAGWGEVGCALQVALLYEHFCGEGIPPLDYR